MTGLARTTVTMSRSLTISFDLHPPVNSTTDPSLKSKVTHSFDLHNKCNQGQDGPEYKAYYNALQSAIVEARMKTGEELTRWRDVVGTLEQAKEIKPVVTKVEEEDEEDEDAEGET